jgi:hypothetical protein
MAGIRLREGGPNWSRGSVVGGPFFWLLVDSTSPVTALIRSHAFLSHKILARVHR